MKELLTARPLMNLDVNSKGVYIFMNTLTRNVLTHTFANILHHTDAKT